MHTAVNGPEALRAAEASECAAEQDQFWAFHDLVYADQVLEGSRLTAEKLTEFAAEIVPGAIYSLLPTASHQ